MPDWAPPVIATVVAAMLAVMGHFLREAHAEIRRLHDDVRSIQQEMYGADRNNGWRQQLKDVDHEMTYIGRYLHWIGNALGPMADKLGVALTEKPKRDDGRR